MIPSMTTPKRTFPNGPSTSAPDGSSGETETKPTTTFSPNWTRQAQPLLEDRAKLSALSQHTLATLGEDMEESYSMSELARLQKLPVSELREELEWLHEETALLTGSFFPLSDQDYADLKEDIEANGVTVPILVGEHIPIIDGLNRWNIALELGIADQVPLKHVTGLSKAQEHEMMLRINVRRRHLTAAQKHSLARAEVLRDPARSSRAIALLCGVSHPTVEKVRQELREEGKIVAAPVSEEEKAEYRERARLPETPNPGLVVKVSSRRAGEELPAKPYDWEKDGPQFEERVDRRGRTHLVDVSPKEPDVTPPDRISVPEPGARTLVGYATCPDGALPGETLAILWSGTYYTLERSRD